MFAEENRQQALTGTTEIAFPGSPEKPFQMFLLMFAEENRQQTLAGTTEMGVSGELRGGSVRRK